MVPVIVSRISGVLFILILPLVIWYANSATHFYNPTVPLPQSSHFLLLSPLAGFIGMWAERKVPRSSARTGFVVLYALGLLIGFGIGLYWLWVAVMRPIMGHD